MDSPILRWRLQADALEAELGHRVNGALIIEACQPELTVVARAIVAVGE